MFASMDLQNGDKSPQDDKIASQDLSHLLRTVTTRALEFLSTASNQAIGACLVGLGASTYIVLGRVGLVLIGVVGGVVLHATWDTGNYGPVNEIGPASRDVPRRRELSLDIARRILDWREKKTSLTSLDIDISQYKSSDYSDFRPETAAALKILSEAVIRDYVKWWYDPVLPNEVTFPSASRQAWDRFVLSVATHLSRKRPVDTFLEFATNSSSILIVFLNELSAALSAAPSLSASKAIKLYLETNPDSSLANILDEKTQNSRLQTVADDILDSYLDPSIYRCAPARIFLRQILANVVMEMSISRCSSDDWINEWIVYLLEGGEPDIINAIDKGVNNTNGGDQSPAEIEISKTRLNIDKSRAKAAHARTVSRAEEAMQEAMQEARRLTQMIAEEEARKRRENEESSAATAASNESTVNNGSDDAATVINNDTANGTTNTSITDDVQSALSSQQHKSTESEVARPRLSLAESAPRESMSVDVEKPVSSSPKTMASPIMEQGRQHSSSISSPTRPSESSTLTLHKANISIFDDSEPGEVQRAMKSKPLSEYLIQIEPASSTFPGWMIPRTYADFETLHEVLRRIATITGTSFNKIHPELPQWKGNAKYRLREGLEQYLMDAVKFEPLAESEGMKRFLDKDRGATWSQNRQSGFWPNPSALESVGKGMLDVLSKAPKGVAGGGKAVIGGVTSVFTSNSSAASVQRKPTTTVVTNEAMLPSRQSLTVERNLSPSSSTLSVATPPSSTTGGEESPRKAPYPTSGRKSPRPAMSSRSNSATGMAIRGGIMSSEAQAQLDAQMATVANGGEEIRLPPLPSEVSDDYNGGNSGTTSPGPKIQLKDYTTPKTTTHMSADGTSLFDIPSPPHRTPKPSLDAAFQHAISVSPTSPSTTTINNTPINTININNNDNNNNNNNNNEAPCNNSPAAAAAAAASSSSSSSSSTTTKTASISTPKAPLNESEARVLIELFFAVTTSLYTLSSAWQIRLTLLNAAKTFLLRPGNPQLESIRTLLQESLLDGPTSDTGMAAHILKIRENCLPTEAELAAWPAERTPEQKEKLRIKARSLLVKRGMPQALTSVMGAAASGEALGKMFDCLQEKRVARGLVYGLLLQAVRALTQ